MSTISERLRERTGSDGAKSVLISTALVNEAANLIDELATILAEADKELQDCSVELTGEDYNNPRLNAALAMARKER